MGVTSVGDLGRIKGQAGLTCGQDDPPVLVDSNSRLRGGGHLDEENSERRVFWLTAQVQIQTMLLGIWLGPFGITIRLVLLVYTISRFLDRFLMTCKIFLDKTSNFWHRRLGSTRLRLDLIFAGHAEAFFIHSSIFIQSNPSLVVIFYSVYIYLSWMSIQSNYFSCHSLLTKICQEEGKTAGQVEIFLHVLLRRQRIKRS